jgi:hypothetical protein
LQDVVDVEPVPTIAKTPVGIPGGAISIDTLLGLVETSAVCMARPNQPEVARSRAWNSGRLAH